MRRSLTLPAGLALLTAFTLGPNYQRPEVSVPPVFRGADAGPPIASTASFGDLAWWNVFQHPDLQELRERPWWTPTISG
jgi:multidrug efflux system outer membrane protein